MTDLFPMPEKDRRIALEAAEARALQLLAAIDGAGLIASGRRESDVERDIARLAEHEFGIEKHWHRRIVRAGINSITIASDHPADRIIGADDTVYLDLGPVLEGWEADIGTTYALGGDPRKHALVAELPRQFAQVQAHYRNDPGINGAALYDFAVRSAEKAGCASVERSQATSSASSRGCFKRHLIWAATGAAIAP